VRIKSYIGVASLLSLSVAHAGSVPPKPEATTLEMRLNSLENKITTLKGRIQTLEAKLDEVSETTTALKDLPAYLTIDQVGGVDEVRITGANLRVVNQMSCSVANSTNDACSDGTGNIILGMLGIASGTSMGTGSHNLVISPNAGYQGNSGIVAGVNNGIEGFGGVILGGRSNNAYSNGVIVNGTYNRVQDYGVVVSGSSNTATTVGSVLGGYSNVATGSYSTVTGGESNSADGSYSSVSGGKARTASGVDDWRAGSLFETN
jgi:hypothetical protein